MSERLRRGILQDVMTFTEDKIAGIINHGLEILPDDQHAEFVVVVTLQHLATMVNSLGKHYPLFGKLPRALQVLAMANLLGRALPLEEQKRSAVGDNDTQILSDVAAAVNEIEKEIKLSVE